MASGANGTWLRQELSYIRTRHASNLIALMRHLKQTQSTSEALDEM
jgi:hypothetical protein